MQIHELGYYDYLEYNFLISYHIYALCTNQDTNVLSISHSTLTVHIVDSIISSLNYLHFIILRWKCKTAIFYYLVRTVFHVLNILSKKTTIKNLLSIFKTNRIQGLKVFTSTYYVPFIKVPGTGLGFASNF